jgi:hypothetical protein
MAGEFDGSRAVLVNHQHTRAQTSSLLGTDVLPPFISFSTNYPEPPKRETVVVEGTSRGRLSGKTWAGGETPGGRFCNVFKFRGDRISSLHVYLDPDYTGEDIPRFRWGVNRKW